MPLFLWKKSYELKIPEIDMQHRRLVGMINELSDAMLEKRGYRTVPHILEELSEYVQQHFADEEKIMMECNYPEMDQHVREHREFAKKVIGFKEMYAQEHQLDTRELLDFLCDWLKNHITVDDKAIAEHLRLVKLGVGRGN